MSKTLPNGRLCNRIIRNLAASFIAEKNNLAVDYSSYDEIKRLGIELYCGDTAYSETVVIMDDTYFSFLNRDTKLMANIDLNHNYFQTEEITNLIHKHLHDKRNRVIEANAFRERYENNRDIFIHMRLDDVAERNPGIEYYKSCLEGIVREKDYQDIYIASDSPDHEMIAQLRAAYPSIQPFRGNEVDTIHFGSTCKYVILSHGTFSGMIGYLAFFTDEIYYPDENKTNGWSPMSVFTGKGWIPK